MDVKEGDTATFGDVLWALGNPSKNPKKFRPPAAPKEGYTVPIHRRLSRKDWIFYRALNDFTNPKAHPVPIPEVDGKIPHSSICIGFESFYPFNKIFMTFEQKPL